MSGPGEESIPKVLTIGPLTGQRSPGHAGEEIVEGSYSSPNEEEVCGSEFVTERLSQILGGR